MPRKGKGKGKGKGKIGRKGKGKGNNRKGKGKSVIRIIHKYADIEIKLDNNQKYDVTFKGNKNNFSLVVNNPSINTIPNNTPEVNNPPEVDIPPHIEDPDADIRNIYEIPDEAYDHDEDFIFPDIIENDVRAYNPDELPEEAL